MILYKSIAQVAIAADKTRTTIYARIAKGKVVQVFDNSEKLKGYVIVAEALKFIAEKIK